MSYFVYFNANSNNCSGWLNVDNTDIAVNGHFMENATEFKTREDALNAAKARLEKIYALCDRVAEHQSQIASSMSEAIKYDAEEDKKRYQFFILQR